jgi:hypothetical protein
LSIYPFAEDFVDTVDPSVRKPYKFNAYRTRWLPLILNKLELWWRRLWHADSELFKIGQCRSSQTAYVHAKNNSDTSRPSAVERVVCAI